MNSQLNELQKNMSELNDETLLQIVEVDYADYRKDALDCAKHELAARGIVYDEPVEKEAPTQPEEKEDTFHPELVTVATYTTPYEAQIAKGMLETNGIPVFVANEHFVGANWLLSNAVGGVELQVTETDAEQARTLLDGENVSDLVIEESAEAQPVEIVKEGYAPQMKTLARAMLFIVLIVMAIGGWNFSQQVIPPRHSPLHDEFPISSVDFSRPKPMTEEELTARFMRTHTAILAQCQGIKKTYISFQVLETLLGKDVGRKTLKIDRDKEGQIFNFEGYAEEILPGDKTVLFVNPDDLANDLTEDRILKPVEFLTAFYDKADKKKEQEMILQFIGLPLFFADTGEAYSHAPESVPLKDFLFSLKKLR